MGDTIPDGGTQSAPTESVQQPVIAPTVAESPAPEGGPAWGRTILDQQDVEQDVYAAFRIVSGTGAGRLFDLKVNGDTRLGRDAALNDIVLNDPKASAQQMIVRASGDEFGVIDLGSTNGTFVNGERVLAPVTLKADDRVSVGAVVMVFHIAYAKEPEGETDQGSAD